MIAKATRLLATSALALAVTAAQTDANAEQSDSAPPEDAILILDASGSMWGQIDGVNKIVIAKDVVETIIRSLPETQKLGMVAYGHRKKGDCNDIQTLADVGANRQTVIKEIRGLSPVGMTPLTKSVEHAANELNYTKNAATVILVSDGLETCDADPCALARTLEENGLDFKVHVVGFDVTEEERQGLQCIAEETGGEFLAADNADELTDALTQVAVTDGNANPSDASIEPKPQTVALKATVLQNGPDIQSKLNWVIADRDTGETVFSRDNTGYVDFEITPGNYIATATWTGWPHEGDRVGGDKIGTREFTIAAAPTVVTVPIDLDIPVTLEADSEIAEGNPVSVSWSGPDDLGASITVTKLDDGPREHIYFTFTQRARDTYEKEAIQNGKSIADIDTNGDGTFDQDDQAETLVGGPSEDGQYEVRYVLSSPRLILARTPLTVTDGNYTLSGPDDVMAGSTFDVQWSGALTDGDFIALEKAGTKSAYTPGVHAKLKDDEDTVTLTAAAEPGDYEIRYVLANGYTTYTGMQHAVQASIPITISAATANISGPAEVVGGANVVVDVEPVVGDAWKDDYVSLIKPGANKYNRDSWKSLSKATNEGTRITFQAPNIDGDYEIAYFLAPGDKVLARQPIKVTRATATVDAPATVKVGENFDVTYTGPAYRGDRVVLVYADKSDTSMFNATVAYGFPVKQDETSGSGTVRGAKAASKPGDYEIRYTTGHQHQVLARAPVKVVE